MIVKRLRLYNFKNYTDELFEFGARVNLITGDNGMGKTNVLDALYFVALTKSHSLLTDGQLRRDQIHDYVVEALFGDGDQTDLYKIVFEKGQKRVSHNRENYKRLQDHIGRVPVVFVFPDETRLIFDDASVRRRYMDQSISQYDKTYLEKLVIYKRALAQRNAVLKNENMAESEKEKLLTIYDQQMSQLVPYICMKRRDFCSSVNKVINQEYDNIADNRSERVGLMLKTKVEADSYLNQLANCRSKDLIMGRTTTGIHRDDVGFFLNERPLKKYGSQGQIKSFLIALKLANFHLFEDKLGAKPLLLLDDIFDKLDEKRIENLLQTVLIKDFGQVFITTTSSYVLQQILMKKGVLFRHYLIKNGQIVRDEKEEE